MTLALNATTPALTDIGWYGEPTIDVVSSTPRTGSYEWIPKLGESILLLRGTHDIGNVTKIVLKENGVERFEKFKRFNDGWDFGIGKKLSLMSVASLETFMNSYSSVFDTTPSLFLSHEGNLILEWDTKDNRLVSIEFKPDSLSLFLEKEDGDHEADFDLKNLSSLVQAIK